jgi:hypothetical protein
LLRFLCDRYKNNIPAVYEIAVKPGTIKDIVTERGKEQASAARICALLEQNNFQPLRFDTGTNVISDYAGTVFIEFEKMRE